MGKTSHADQMWLDPSMTSAYELYQYFLQRSDAESPQLLKSLTLLDNEELEATLNDSSVRAIQNKLADFVVEFVHGKNSLKAAKEVTSVLHTKKPSLRHLHHGDVLLETILTMAPVLDFSENESLQVALVKCTFFRNRKVVSLIAS